MAPRLLLPIHFARSIPLYRVQFFFLLFPRPTGHDDKKREEKKQQKKKMEGQAPQLSPKEIGKLVTALRMLEEKDRNRAVSLCRVKALKEEDRRESFKVRFAKLLAEYKVPMSPQTFHSICDQLLEASAVAMRKKKVASKLIAGKERPF